MLLIGLDAASRLEKFGYAIGRLNRGKIEVTGFGVLQSEEQPDALNDVIVPQVRHAARALIAIDAPLGWPTALGRALANHRTEL